VRSPSADPALRRRDAGSVTAELAVGLVGVVLGLALVLSVALTATAQVTAVLGAGAGARAAARGEPGAAVVAAARAVAGADGVVTVRAEGDLVRVVVERRVALPLPGAPALRVRGSAAALAEAGTGGA